MSKGALGVWENEEPENEPSYKQQGHETSNPEFKTHPHETCLAPVGSSRAYRAAEFGAGSSDRNLLAWPE